MIGTKHICKIEPIYGADPGYNFAYLLNKCKDNGLSDIAKWAEELPKISFDQYRAVAFAIKEMRRKLHESGVINGMT